MKLKVKNDLISGFSIEIMMEIFSVMMMVPSDALLQEMFEQSDNQHNGDPHGHPQELKEETDQVSSLLFSLQWVGVTRGEFRHHVHQRNVEEDAGRGAEYPGRDVTEAAQQQSCGHPYEGEDGGEDVVEDRLSHRHPCLQ